MEYDRTDVSEGIDIDKTSNSHEFIIYHYWCLLKINFGYQPLVCNVCHNLLERMWTFLTWQLLKKVIIELIFGVCVKMKLYIEWQILILLIKLDNSNKEKELNYLYCMIMMNNTLKSTFLEKVLGKIKIKTKKTGTKSLSSKSGKNN